MPPRGARGKGNDRLIKRHLCFILLICFIASALLAAACSAGEDGASSHAGVSRDTGAVSGGDAYSEGGEDADYSDCSAEELDPALPKSESEVKKYRTGDVKAEPPVIAEAITAEEMRGAVSGTCAEGAEVFAVLRSNVIGYAKSSHGTFVMELKLPNSRRALDIKLYACEKGKNASDPVTFELNSWPSGEYPAPGVVWVGSEGWLFFNNTEAQYTNDEPISDRAADRIKRRVAENVSDLAEKGIELIYVLIPNPNELYSEYMPKNIVKGSVSLREQISSALSSGGATVLDIGPALKEQLGNTEFELYHHTDSHWTEYSAYFAYKALCDEFSKKFPAAKARDISEFGFANEFREAGDLYYDLGLQKHLLKFRSTFSHITFETPVDRPKYASPVSTVINDANMEQMDFTNPDGAGKPSFLMLRDSYSIMLFDWLSERASQAHFKPLWDFEIDAGEAASLGVDYVIVFICDMNLKSIIR